MVFEEPERETKNKGLKKQRGSGRIEFEEQGRKKESERMEFKKKERKGKQNLISQSEKENGI